MAFSPEPAVHRAALVRTRYAETDQMGFIYHSHFFAYFETGRCELIRDHGMTYAQLEGHGVRMPLRACGAEFRQAAHYDDLLAIGTRIAAMTPVRIRFEYAVHRLTESGATHLANGFTEHLFIDQNGRPTRLNKRPEIWGVLSRLTALAAFPAPESALMAGAVQLSD